MACKSASNGTPTQRNKHRTPTQCNKDRDVQKVFDPEKNRKSPIQKKFDPTHELKIDSLFC